MRPERQAGASLELRCGLGRHRSVLDSVKTLKLGYSGIHGLFVKFFPHEPEPVMRLGIVTFATDDGIQPAELAIEVERRGFSSLFFAEHSNIPASRDTPYPGGGDVPPEYYRTYDPFVALSFAAAATSTLRIGTGVCLLAQRDTIHTAKAVASIDRLSEGRFDFGVGAGWNVDEARQHGIDPRTRTRRLTEQMRAMKELWANEIAQFDGEQIHISPTTVRPSPLQRPHPPVLVAGMGPTVIERVLEIGDGWAPLPSWSQVDQFAAMLTDLRSRSEALGRSVPVHVFGVAGHRQQVERYAGLGVDECVILLPTLPPAQAVEALGEVAEELIGLL